MSLVARGPVFDPFLQVAPAIDLVRRQSSQGGFQSAAKLFVDAQDTARLDTMREQLTQNRDVHGRRRRKKGQLPVAVQVPVLR